QAGRHARDIAKLPYLSSGPDGEPGPAIGKGQTHWGLKPAVVRVEMVSFVANYHEPAGLVGGHEQGCAKLTQERGEVRCVASDQRPGIRTHGSVGCRGMC